MEGVQSPTEVLKPSKFTLKNIFNVILWILLIVVIILLVYWFSLPKFSLKKIKSLISDEAKGYGASAPQVEKILLQGAYEIISQYHLMKQAKEFSKTSGIDIEKVIVDNAVVYAKQYQYIK